MGVVPTETSKVVNDKPTSPAKPTKKAVMVSKKAMKSLASSDKWKRRHRSVLEHKGHSGSLKKNPKK